MKSTHAVLPLTVMVLLLSMLSGCGPSIYYQNILFSGQGSTADAKQILEATAAQLGYGSCGVGRAGTYCNGDMYVFRVVREGVNELEIEFESIYGGKQQGAARQALATELQQRCPPCQLRIKDHRVRGLIDDDTGWMRMPQ